MKGFSSRRKYKEFLSVSTLLTDFVNCVALPSSSNIRRAVVPAVATSIPSKTSQNEKIKILRKDPCTRHLRAYYLAINYPCPNPHFYLASRIPLL
ncbi:uncharacterized protein BDW70DRAFT_144142 [Aspergillus foveolatus]|uniref:uncharacterized protein n=1 Tax=Aspergillus foveolatus TaxID=210207 RepID=UPI003CCDF7D0